MAISTSGNVEIWQIEVKQTATFRILCLFMKVALVLAARTYKESVILTRTEKLCLIKKG